MLNIYRLNKITSTTPNTAKTHAESIPPTSIGIFSDEVENGSIALAVSTDYK